MPSRYGNLNLYMAPTNTCQPAHPVIDRLGGRKVVARHLGVSVSTLSRWCAPAPTGTGGRIPQKHWNALLDLALERGTRLTLKNLAGM